MDLREFAEALIETSKRMDTARSMDDALDAWNEFNALCEDHGQIRLLAQMYRLYDTGFQQLD